MNIRGTLLSVVMLCLLVITVGCGTLRSPGGTAKNFFEAVEAGEIEEAMGLLSSRVTGTFGQEKIKGGLIQQSKNISNKGGITSIEILEEVEKGELAEVTVKVTFGDGTSQTEKIFLIEENQRWKIDLNK